MLLDVLPIAAAIVGRTPSGHPKLVDRNGRFDEIMAAAFGDQALVSGGFPDCPQRALLDLMTAYLTDFEVMDEYEFTSGDGVGARHFTVKLAPLAPCPTYGPRCLVSIVDRTAEAQSERSLRAEMLRDSLTGLPNRLGFTDMIEAGSGDGGKRTAQSDRAPAHAVLVVDIRRFSSINESMGSMAGDELLITFARRLMSTLRSGDVLARTGGDEFGVLVCVKRGLDDAFAAAERIQQVLATPFRLSELEIRVECAIGIALTQGGQESEELFRNAQFTSPITQGQGGQERFSIVAEVEG